MRQPDIRVVAAGDVRGSLLGGGGDLRADIAFQNDINGLIAQFEEARIPWRALSAPTPHTPAAESKRPAIRVPAVVPVLRVFDGGGLVDTPMLAQARGVASEAIRVINAAPAAGPGRRARRGA